MPFGSTSNSRIAYIAESTFGTTPATPVFKELRRTTGGPELRKGTVISGQVSSSRDVRAEPQISQDIQGNIGLEFSHATLDDFLEAVMGGTWTTNVLKTGATARSFTIEETIIVGATSNYHRYLGCAINTLEIGLQSRSIMTGSVGIMGQKLGTLATAIIAGATYTAGNTEPIFTADKAASLTILGATPLVKNLSFSINNNLRMRPAVGTLYSDEFGQGQIEITGKFDAYFADNALLTSILAHGAGALSFTIGVDTNKKYTFSFPNVQLNNGSVTLGGRDDDVMVSVDFRALYDSGTSTTGSITRVVA